MRICHKSLGDRAVCIGAAIAYFIQMCAANFVMKTEIQIIDTIARLKGGHHVRGKKKAIEIQGTAEESWGGIEQWLGAGNDRVTRQWLFGECGFNFDCGGGFSGNKSVLTVKGEYHAGYIEFYFVVGRLSLYRDNG